MALVHPTSVAASTPRRRAPAGRAARPGGVGRPAPGARGASASIDERRPGRGVDGPPTRAGAARGEPPPRETSSLARPAGAPRVARSERVDLVERGLAPRARVHHRAVAATAQRSARVHHRVVAATAQHPAHVPVEAARLGAGLAIIDEVHVGSWGAGRTEEIGHGPRVVQGAAVDFTASGSPRRAAGARVVDAARRGRDGARRHVREARSGATLSTTISVEEG